MIAQQLPPFGLVLWGVPLCLTLHNAEEALGVHELVRLLRALFPWFGFSGGQFLAGLTLTTAGVWAGAAALSGTDRAALLLFVQAGLCFNAFVPHIALTIRERRYTPGVATAVLFVLPFSAYLFARAAGR